MHHTLSRRSLVRRRMHPPTAIEPFYYFVTSRATKYLAFFEKGWGFSFPQKFLTICRLPLNRPAKIVLRDIAPGGRCRRLPT